MTSTVPDLLQRALGSAPRVLHVSQPTTAGVGRCVADLVADQRAAGWDALVACPADVAGSPLEGLGRLPWEATRSPGPSSLREARTLRALVEDVQPDLVHLHSSKAGLAGRLALRGRIPTVFQPHAWSFQAVDGPVGRASLAWERTGHRWTTRTVCVSEAERRVGVEAGLGDRAVVLENGVDLARYAPTPSARGAARALLGLDQDAPTVVCVGRLARQKGQDVLLDAWRRVHALHPDARLVLVGDGPDEDALRAQAGDGVLFAGPTPSAAPWLAAADVVAVPSRWEAMALVVLEAMAAGRSVVATDVGAARECLVPAGAGALVAPDDAEALAAALLLRLERPAVRTAEGEAGRREAERRFDVRLTAPRTRDLYSELLGVGRRVPAQRRR